MSAYQRAGPLYRDAAAALSFDPNPFSGVDAAVQLAPEHLRKPHQLRIVPALLARRFPRFSSRGAMRLPFELDRVTARGSI